MITARIIPNGHGTFKLILAPSGTRTGEASNVLHDIYAWLGAQRQTIAVEVLGNVNSTHEVQVSAAETP